MKRFLARLLFAVLSAALLYGIVTYPPSPYTPTLYITETYPLAWRVTDTVRTVKTDVPGKTSESLDEPPVEPEPIPDEPGDILALMYHNLSEDEEEAGEWTTTPEAFADQLDDLASYGYLPLSIEDYIAGNYKYGQDYYILTFDDGYLSNLTLAEPLLRERGVPASVFVITGSTEMENHMSWEQLAELQSGGVISVYSHTHSHLNGAETATATFLADVETAWRAICAHLDEPEYRILSYPNGGYTREIMQLLAQDGYVLFVMQNIPAWYKEPNEYGIRILVRLNAAHEADMLELADYSRERAGLSTTVTQKLKAEQKAELERLDALRRERQAWLKKQTAIMQRDVR